jgi:hypothetical protein
MKTAGNMVTLRRVPLEGLVMHIGGWKMKLIYIGEDFYWESGTAMSSIYTEDGQRSDWGFVTIALQGGEHVEIRPATSDEIAFYAARLSDIKRKRESEDGHNAI